MVVRLTFGETVRAYIFVPALCFDFVTLIHYMNMIVDIFFEIYFITRRFGCRAIGRWKFHVLLHYGVHRDSSVSVVTGLGFGDQESRFDLRQWQWISVLSAASSPAVGVTYPL